MRWQNKLISKKLAITRRASWINLSSCDEEGEVNTSHNKIGMMHLQMLFHWCKVEMRHFGTKLDYQWCGMPNTSSSTIAAPSLDLFSNE
jgi:hypothetical protein